MSAEASRVVEDNDKEKKGKERVKEKKGIMDILSFYLLYEKLFYQTLQ